MVSLLARLAMLAIKAPLWCLLDVLALFLKLFLLLPEECKDY